VPPDVISNAHIYYVLATDASRRELLIESLNRAGINAVFHYVPLHTSAAGQRYARTSGDLSVTEDVADRLVRLPLWPAMTESDVGRVVAAVYGVLDRAAPRVAGRASE
jgi:dTDP-4-amino-4,6-dideoxygalactose transaminase